MRITEAAQRLGTSPRMLRYRDMLGLLPPVRPAVSARGSTPPPRGQAPGPHGPESPDGQKAPVTTSPGPWPPATGRGPAVPPRTHRRFGDADLAAVAHALRIERRYDISPAALAFGLRVLAEPGVRAEVAELGRRVGRIGPAPARALEFEKERALRLLRLPPGRPPAS